MFSIGKKNLVGIDIGCDSIKVMKLKGIKDNEIATIAYERIVCEKHDGDRFDNLTQSALKNIVKNHNLAQNPSVSIINDPSTSFINIDLPPLPKDELKPAIRFELKKQLSFPIEEAVYDFFIKDKEGDKSQSITVTAIAIKKSAVEKHMGVLKDAGYKPTAIEIGAIPLLAAYDYNYTWEPNKKVALLDIGASKTILAIVKEGTIRFFREIPMSGSFFTNFFAAAYGLAFAEADEKKINLIGSAAGRDALFADIVDSEKLQTLFEQFALELQRSFDYYQARYREGPVNSLVLSGGGALVHSLDRYFKETLGVEVTVDNPFKKLYFSNKDDEITFTPIAPIFTSALGLALRKG